MNPAKLLEDVLSIIRKYSPILVIHALVLFWISARVLDPAALPHGATIWAALTARIDAALKAVGLSLQLWYVLAALVIAYLTTFEWIRSLLVNLPFLRISFSVRYKPPFLARAGVVLGAQPDPWKVAEALNNLIDDYTQELKDKNQPLPDHWQRDRENRYYSYYGTLLVVLAACIVWALAGAPMARSTVVVWRLVLLISLAAIAVRWRTRHVILMGRNGLAYWALREFTRRNPNERGDPLWYERNLWIEKQARFLESTRRDPAWILQSQLFRLPEPLRKKLVGRLRYSPWWRLGENWDILASWKMKFEDEKVKPPQALSVDGMQKQFAALLECAGAGLCLLAPWELAAAPAANGAGTTYSFARRTHTTGPNALSLVSGGDPSRYEFNVDYDGPNRAFLAEIGNHPIQLLAQGGYPSDGKQWYSLTGPEFAEENWPSYDDRAGKIVHDISISWRMEVHPGSTYLMRAKSPGAQWVLGFQCFRVDDRATVLLAWRILSVYLSEEEAPEVYPWWKPRAWKGLLQPKR